MDTMEMIYKNVKALAKLNHENLSDVERAIGVSVGYLSRCKSLKIEKIQALASHFGKGIDDLIVMDYWSVYREEFAASDLRDAVKRTKKVIRGSKILEIVNEELEMEL